MLVTAPGLLVVRRRESRAAPGRRNQYSSLSAELAGSPVFQHQSDQGNWTAALRPPLGIICTAFLSSSLVTCAGYLKI